MSAPAKPCAFRIVLKCPSWGCLNRVEMMIPDDNKLTPITRFWCMECSRKRGKLIEMKPTFEKVSE